MIVCPHCSKENQDRYRFCLGCGAELPRDAAHAPKSFTAPTPPAGIPAAGGGGAYGAPPPQGGGFGGPPPQAGFGAPPPQAGFGAPPPQASFGMGMPVPAPAPMPAPAPAPMPVAPAAAAGGEIVKCSNCGNSNNRSFKFCGTCGAPLNASVPAMAAPAPAPAPAPTSSGGPQRGTLVLIRADGSEGDSFPIQERTVIGREAGGLFASDSYLSPRHATFQFGPQGLVVQDEGSLNGVYMRIAADTPTELKDRSIFRIGQEIIRFERLTTQPPKDGVELMGSPSPNFIGRICLIIGRESNGNCYPIPQGGLHLGRERGDILFPDDGYVSGLHCRLHEEGGRMMLTDVGSSNGTFTRLAAPTAVPAGSMLLLGQQLFRVEY